MPRVVDAEQRRGEVVDAAWTVIAEEGLDAATVRRIAEVAGCTTGRVTHWFADKSDVLLAVLQRVHEAAADRMATVIAAEGSGTLRAVLVEALPLDAERRLEWRVWLAFWGAALADADLRRENRRRYGEWRRGLRALVMAEQVRGTLDATLDLDTVVDGLVALIDGLGIQATVSPTRTTTSATLAVLDAHLALLGRHAPAPDR